MTVKKSALSCRTWERSFVLELFAMCRIRRRPPLFRRDDLSASSIEPGAPQAAGRLVSRCVTGVLTAVCAAALLLGPPGNANAAGTMRLHTNQDYNEELRAATRLPVDNPVAMFGSVFEALPDRVKVYPTENYYYFTFLNDGAPWNGNIRLDASDRDKGKLHFAYSEDLADWREETDVIHVVLDRTNEVEVDKVERFLYRVTYRGKTVLFELNDLSGVKPPDGTLAPDEKFVGPIFDESGLRFFLVFNTRLKLFHYVLDETAPVPEQFVPEKSGRIVVGNRTGYGFFVDDRRPRKILVGVAFINSRVNNYFDGPFDQLPDNFITDDSFRDMILSVAPELKGKIDRYGGWGDGAQRFMIAPYYYYQSPKELAAFDRCATDKRVPEANHPACFVVDEESQQRFDPVPRAIKELRGRGRKKG
ncbi:hypothetical protein CCR97_29875 [Rhodoplanes elegans]|uniref:Uncharacterized protein n=2 Tax=Rhodoplanes elegans TaxID=29408 RepID=A0A327KLW3_9BRAD|nr:hypothetical protein [Rhodoplanes elegans]RAI39850.1 hypothetical protein CH338_08135 [Rhodoplanes elegans]